jgi:hypothetical protein
MHLLRKIKEENKRLIASYYDLKILHNRNIEDHREYRTIQRKRLEDEHKSAQLKNMQSLIPLFKNLLQTDNPFFLKNLKLLNLCLISPEMDEEFNPKLHYAVEGDGSKIETTVRKGLSFQDYCLVEALVTLK